MNSLFSEMSKPVRHNPAVRNFDQWWDAETRRRAKRLKAIYTIEDKDVYNALVKLDSEQCKNSYVYWVSNYGWVTNPKHPVPARRQIPFVLWPDQYKIAKKAIASMQGEDKTVYLINKTREGGVSWIIVSVYYWMWRFHSNFLAKMGSRKQDLVDDKTIDSLFGKMRYLHKRQPSHLRERKVKDILLNVSNLRNGSEIIGESTNKGFGRGGRRTSILIDEYAHVPREIAFQCWAAIESVATSVILPSSPNGPGNKFYDLYCSLPSEWVDEYDWTINPYRDEDWKKNILLSLTLEEFNEEYECSFDVRRGGKVFQFDKDTHVYTEESFEWNQAKEIARTAWQFVAGWDFGTGPSNTSCLLGLVNYVDGDNIPDLYIDDELVFNRVASGKIAAEVFNRQLQYGSSKIHYGDPAAVHKESDQSSWENNLRDAGINFYPLHQWYNTVEGITHLIQIVQWMIDSGKLKIHARCRILIESINNWMWNVPDGIPIEHANKNMILPRKDYYSHQCNALMYLCGAVHDLMRRREHVERQAQKSLERSSLSSVMKTARRV